jgi:hypothetical protein
MEKNKRQTNRERELTKTHTNKQGRDNREAGQRRVNITRNKQRIKSENESRGGDRKRTEKN